MNFKKPTILFLGGMLIGNFFLAQNVFADSLQKAINIVTGISVYLDGKPLGSTNAQGNPISFYHNGTVYVDVHEIAAALGKTARWDSDTRSYYIGDGQQNYSQTPPRPQQKSAYLIDVCPPYQAYDNGGNKANQYGSPYRTPETLTVAGKKYEKAFILGGWNGLPPQCGWALYNLDGKYSMFSFDVGHMHNGIIKIYLDGKKVLEETIVADALPKHYDVELNRAKQMKIEFVQGNNLCRGKDFAFLNATIR